MNFMNRSLPVVVLIVAASSGTFTADTKKETTAKQIVGTWKCCTVYSKGKISLELIRIYSPARRFYVTLKSFNADGQETGSKLEETGTYSVDDDGNLVEVAEPNYNRIVSVDWLNQNSVMLRFSENPPIQYKRSE